MSEAKKPVAETPVEPVVAEDGTPTATDPLCGESAAPVAEMVPVAMVDAMKAELDGEIGALKAENLVLIGRLETATAKLADKPAAKKESAPTAVYRGDFIPEGHPAHKSAAVTSAGQQDYVPAKESFPCHLCDYVGKSKSALAGHSATHK